VVASGLVSASCLPLLPCEFNRSWCLFKLGFADQSTFHDKSGTVASIVRLHFIVVEAYDSYDSTCKAFTHVPQISLSRFVVALTTCTGATVDTVIWSLIELLCAVVCSSMPALRPYVDPWITRVASTLSIGGTRGGSRVSKSTGPTSTVTSNATYNDLKKGRSSYAMSALSPTSPSGHWKELDDELQMLEPAALRAFHSRTKSGDLEAGSRSFHETQLRDGLTSDSENELIFQGVAVTYNVKVWSKSRDDLMGGPGLERSVSVNGTRVSTVTGDRL
jgi:hypothetical protein